MKSGLDDFLMHHHLPSVVDLGTCVQILFVVGFPLIAFRATQIMCARHLLKHGRKDALYWIKAGLGGMAGAALLGLWLDGVDYVNHGFKPLTDHSFVATITCLLCACILLPVFSFFSFLSWRLKKSFPTFFSTDTTPGNAQD